MELVLILLFSVLTFKVVGQAFTEVELADYRKNDSENDEDIRECENQSVLREPVSRLRGPKCMITLTQ